MGWLMSWLWYGATHFWVLQWSTVIDQGNNDTFITVIFCMFYYIPLARAECDDSLLFSGVSSIPLCYVFFSCHPSPPTILPSSLTSSCYLFLGLLLNLVVPKFIYNTLLGILFSSILCTCPTKLNSVALVRERTIPTEPQTNIIYLTLLSLL